MFWFWCGFFVFVFLYLLGSHLDLGCGDRGLCYVLCCVLCVVCVVFVCGLCVVFVCHACNKSVIVIIDGLQAMRV